MTIPHKNAPTLIAKKVAVLGAGAWGTALAIHLAKAGHKVNLWSHSVSQVQQLSKENQNSRYLAGILFPQGLTVSSSLIQTVELVEAVLVVVPSGVFRGVLQMLSKTVTVQNLHIAWATKGFEPKTQSLLHQVAMDVLGDTVGISVLSGPTFADEVAKGLPTAMVSASNNKVEAQYWADLFHFDTFRVYTQSDMVGVEVGGAYKNIMAIAAGLSDGLGLGANARAALVSRGMAEMMRFGQALGAQPETLMGLAGLGDLVLTCTDDLSRNRRFGKCLAATNQAANVVIKEIGQVVEGVKAVIAVKQIASKMGLDLPIMDQVYRVVVEETSPKEAAMVLLSRSGKPESH